VEATYSFQHKQPGFIVETHDKSTSLINARFTQTQLIDKLDSNR
jgi:hypothetical protein